MIKSLIVELCKLPGVGEKTAYRFADFILKQPISYAQQLAQAVLNTKKKILFCSPCQTFCESSPCDLCQDPLRNPLQICIVEKPIDIFTFEKINKNRPLFQGHYHVLHGLLKPLEGLGPESLTIEPLLQRLIPFSTQQPEVIFAIETSLEGKTTTSFIAQKLPSFVKITQLASHIPLGISMDYIDPHILQHAFEKRTELKR